MLPPELLTPGNLVTTVFVGLGLAVGAAIVYVRKNLMVPSQTKTTDLIVAGGSILDMTEFREFRKDIARCANALEELARLRREQVHEEEMEEKMAHIFEKLVKRLGDQ